MDGVIRVLAVEDDPASRMLLAALLDPLPDFTLCAAAEDGLEGLAALERERPDALLLDLVMPGLDGLGFLRALRDRGLYRPAAVVVISHIGGERLIQHVLSLGADYYFVKPVYFPALVELLRALCGRSLEEIARELLLEMGGSGLGMEAACSAAAELARDRSGTLYLKQAYAPFIQRERTDYRCVEKNIRNLTGKLHTGGSPVYQALMGGMPEARPKNEEFLRRLARAALKRWEEYRQGR